MAVTDLDRYLFDLHGFLVVPGALSADEVAEMNAVIDDRYQPVPGQPMTGLAPLLEWGEPFRRLIDHESVLGHLEEWIEPGLRLDSAYGIHTVDETPKLDLHLGGTPYLPMAHYHHRDGRAFIGLSVVSWALTDVPEGAHGFVCIPGSHKANHPCPPDVEALESDPGGCLRQIPMRAGDAIVFSEALTHGSYPWTLPFPRRVLFYRYTPGHMAFDVPHWDDALREMVTDRQRLLLEDPYGRRTFDPPEHEGGNPPRRRPVR